MYDHHFGFTGRPFQLTPDPAFFFENGTHRKALSYLGYGLAQGEGFILITGEIGAGKTTLVGHLASAIDPARLTMGQLPTTRADGEDMLGLVLTAFGQPPVPGGDKAAHWAAVETFLRGEARAGRRSLLVVDEAQTLAPAALEELRLLSNLQLGPVPLLQIVLLGQPEFRDAVLTHPETEQLRQRIIAMHHLDPMGPDEVEPYILHRLARVGWSGRPELTPPVFAELHEQTGGIPRRINALMTRVMMWAAIEQIDRIEAIHVRAAAAEMAGAGRGEADDAPVAPAPTLTPAPVPEPVAQTEAAPQPREAGATIRVLPTPAAPRGPERGELTLLEARLEAAERQLAEQDAIMRKMLASLIDWAEREPGLAPTARGWAA